MNSVQLEAQEWSQLLALLAQGPWHVANPLIMKIGEQLRVQQGPLAVPGTQVTPPGNSDARDKVEH
jgi:hypothetical protein